MDGARLRLRRQYMAIASVFAALLPASFAVFGRPLIDQFSPSCILRE